MKLAQIATQNRTFLSINRISSLCICTLFFILLTGCASVKMASQEENNLRKQFTAPKEGQVGLYIYRRAIFFGDGITRKINLDGHYVGGLPVETYLFLSVGAGSHTLSTESSVSDNKIELTLEEGKNYFIKQFMYPGAPFMGSAANLRIVSDEIGKKEILEIELIAPTLQ